MADRAGSRPQVAAADVLQLHPQGSDQEHGPPGEARGPADLVRRVRAQERDEQGPEADDPRRTGGLIPFGGSRARPSRTSPTASMQGQDTTGQIGLWYKTRRKTMTVKRTRGQKIINRIGVAVIGFVTVFGFLMVTHAVGVEFFHSNSQGLWFYGNPAGANFGVSLWNVGFEFKGMPGPFVCDGQC